MVKGLAFDAATHTYAIDGKHVPSVTQVLSILYDWSRIDPAVLERKRQIGEDVHHAIDLDAKGDLAEESITGDWAPYFLGWRKFVAESQFKPLATEVQVCSRKQRFAGTLDCLGELNGATFVIDFKTTAALHPAVALQVAAYHMAAVESGVAGFLARRAALMLTEDGRYSLTEYREPTDISYFCAALRVHHWKTRYAA